MHGVKREKYTEAVAKARRQAELQRIQEYRLLNDKASSLRREGNLGDESLQATASLLALNAELYSMWNFRRLIFQDRIDKCPKEEVQALLEQELKFLVEAIKGHPKSYWVWHHRVWVMEHIPTPNWKHEVLLCSKMLDLDSRNFHCWDYRRRMLSHLESSGPAEELEFTYQKIAQNFSNYSAFHLRSKLLPLVYPATEAEIQREALEKEFELVRDAVFTEPADQSPWLYHRWLLGKSQQQLELLGAFRKKDGEGREQLFAVFSEAVHLTAQEALSVLSGEDRIHGRWDPAHHAQGRACHTWTFNPEQDLPAGHDLVLQVQAHQLAANATLRNELASSAPFLDLALAPEAAPGEAQAATVLNQEILRKELSSISELIEIEPDSKWPLLTSAFIRHALGEYKEPVGILERLKTLDPFRLHFYEDFESKLAIEHATRHLLSPTFPKLKRAPGIDLSAKSLTSLQALERLSLVSSVDMSNNHIHDLSSLFLLVCAEEVLLDGNKLEAVHGLRPLKFLKTLSVKDNRIRNLHSFEGLESLRSLDLRGNPVCEMPEYRQAVKRLLPSLKTLDGAPL